MNAEAGEVRSGPAEVGVKGGGMRRGGAEARGEEGAVVLLWQAAAAWCWAARAAWTCEGKTREGWSP